MIRNYLKLAWRNLGRHKAFTAVNILGLSIGIAFVLLASTYIWKELNVNKGLRNADNIFLVQSRWADKDMGLDFTTLAPISKALKENYPNLVTAYYRHDGISSIVSN